MTTRPLTQVASGFLGTHVHTHTHTHQHPVQHGGLDCEGIQTDGLCGWGTITQRVGDTAWTYIGSFAPPFFPSEVGK